jgi:hypothetical protein
VPSWQRIADIGIRLHGPALNRPSGVQLPVSQAPTKGDLDTPVSYRNSTSIN